MKKTLFVISVFSLVLILIAAPGMAFADKEFSDTVPLEAGGRLTLKTYKGSIHLSSWDRNEVSIFARISPPEDESNEYRQQAVDATRVEVRRRGDSLYIRSDYDDVPSKRQWMGTSKNYPFVHYEIRAPRTLSVDVDDYKSEIEVYEFAGDINIETYKGQLTANDLDGDIRLDTYKGTARLSGLRGSLDVETYKGDIVLEVAEIDGGSRLETYKGNIELSLPGSQGFDLRADIGRRGSLSGDFDYPMDRSRKGKKSQKIDTLINEGGPALDISTYKGDIRLRRWSGGR